jgi:thiol-disulfide isomerase/thioredoxin
MKSVTTTTYVKRDLDGDAPDSLFTFVPPAGAKQLAAFPDMLETHGLATMTGDTIPALKFKSANGKTVAMESFRGKPVLIDFWATWCGPCVAEMPKLAEIYKQGKEKGLVFLTVDQDEDEAKAAEFLSKHGYDWPNFSDADGGIAKLMGSGPLPRKVLVDAKGQIVYDGFSSDEARLLKHIAELGPEFADFAPKPQQAPCVASK